MPCRTGPPPPPCPPRPCAPRSRAISVLRRSCRHTIAPAPWGPRYHWSRGNLSNTRPGGGGGGRRRRRSCRRVHGLRGPVARSAGEADLEVPGLPAPWSGVSVLHLSDVHAGLFPTNERSLGQGRRLGGPPRARPGVPHRRHARRSAGTATRCLELLARLRPSAGHVRRHRQPRVRPGQGAARQGSGRRAVSGPRPGRDLALRRCARPSPPRRHPARPLRRRLPDRRLRPSGTLECGVQRRRSRRADPPGRWRRLPDPPRPRAAATRLPARCACSRWPSPVIPTAVNCACRGPSGLTAGRQRRGRVSSPGYTSGARACWWSPAEWERASYPSVCSPGRRRPSGDWYKLRSEGIAVDAIDVDHRNRGRHGSTAR